MPPASQRSSPAAAPIARRRTLLPFAPPCLGDDEIDAVVEALRSGWLTTGPAAQAFEQEAAAWLGAPAALALNSGTAALHTALLAAGVGPGDEVIVPTFTFAATANVVEHVGARPVLVDVEPETLLLAPDAVAAAVTPRTRAVVPVHFAGHPADLDALAAIAAPRGILVLEDAAHAIGARYRGRPIGSGANPAAFSFYATKNLTTGEGGMLTGEPALLARARRIGLHGMSRDGWARYGRAGAWRYDVTLPGFKYNMSDIQAALGRVQLRRLPAMQRRRAELVGLYRDGLASEDALRLPVARPDVEHAWHLFVIRLEPEVLRIGRDRFIRALAHRRIGASVHFIPLHLHTWYRRRYGYEPARFPVAQQAFERVVSLPLSAAHTPDDVADVVGAVRDLVRRYRR